MEKIELYKAIDDYWNKHNIDGVIAPLNFSITHNFSEFNFTELYNYGDGIYSCYFKYNGETLNWFVETIDLNTLKNIVNKMK